MLENEVFGPLDEDTDPYPCNENGGLLVTGDQALFECNELRTRINVLEEQMSIVINSAQMIKETCALFVNAVSKLNK